MANSGERPHIRGIDEPTIQHVADEAGVSVGTVSNALNHPDRVSESTRRRVRAAIDKTGFIRNGAARSLAAKRSDTIGLIVPNLINSLFVDISKGAQAAAREYGLSLLTADADDDFSLQDRHLDFFAEARSSGILLAPMHDSIAGITRVRAHGRKVVVVNFEYPTVECCSVLMDNRGVGELAVAHMADIGVDRIVFVASDDFVQPVRERRIGVRAACARLDLPLEEFEVVSFDESEGVRAGTDIAQAWMGERIGVLGVTDSLARGVLDALDRLPGIAVPEQIAVMGLDGDRTHWNGPISMTTVELPGYDVGLQAIRMLIDEERDPEHQHRQVTLQARLMPRQSTVPRGRGQLVPLNIARDRA